VLLLAIPSLGQRCAGEWMCCHTEERGCQGNLVEVGSLLVSVEIWSRWAAAELDQKKGIGNVENQHHF
jgi:hypothetical protein